MGAETHAPRDLMGGIIIKSLLLEDAFATVTQVKEIMKTHSWVHFACHAIQDTAEPLKSGVQLHDGRLELLDMMKQQLPDSDLAFLSACQTSTGNEKLPDEVVHLAAGMLAAGYQSVVATMCVDLRVFGSGRHAFLSRDSLVYILRFFTFLFSVVTFVFQTLRTVRIHSVIYLFCRS